MKSWLEFNYTKEECTFKTLDKTIAIPFYVLIKDKYFEKIINKIKPYDAVIHKCLHCQRFYIMYKSKSVYFYTDKYKPFGVVYSNCTGAGCYNREDTIHEEHCVGNTALGGLRGALGLRVKY